MSAIVEALNRRANGGKPTLSFEFFPPKDDAGFVTLNDSFDQLQKLSPDFVSVTYGAGGSNRERSIAVVENFSSRVATIGHLTCVGASRAEVLEVARRYWDEGVRHIVALRGDPPQGATRYEPHPDGFAYGADLVAGLRSVADFEISVAAYPEVHPEAASADADFDNLRRKIDAGATRAITQFFFDNDDYLRFRDRKSVV